jgi:RNA polymerase subunit RPABC4/transcription elongation factor Spt4
MPSDWVACPHCGERIPSKAKACRYCGSDERTGWSEGTYLDGIDLPDEDDYADSLEREGLGNRALRAPRKSAGGRWLMGAVASLLILLFLLWLLRGIL